MSDLIRACRADVVRADGAGACMSLGAGAALPAFAAGVDGAMKLSGLMPSMSAFIIYVAALIDHRAAK